MKTVKVISVQGSEKRRRLKCSPVVSAGAVRYCNINRFFDFRTCSFRTCSVRSEYFSDLIFSEQFARRFRTCSIRSRYAIPSQPTGGHCDLQVDAPSESSPRFVFCRRRHRAPTAVPCKRGRRGRTRCRRRARRSPTR
jgi:hypothetical protein